MKPIIKISQLEKNFGDLTAVNGISFDVKKGEMFGLVGPDGAGKTSTIRILCGLSNASGGDVKILDYDIRKEKKLIQRRIGYLSQRFSLYGDLTIDENIKFFADI
ncbi:ATP-binding cassette domain-containing protein, partial [Bacteroidota bacterium]